ncbi:hypothetical protein V8D89_002045 [Ganoderma adspersum]
MWKYRVPSKKKAKKEKFKIKECTGCAHKFMVTGYFHHLRQTTKSTCIAIREAEAQYESNDSSSSSPTSTPSSNAAHHFEGDYYGKYDPTDFADYDEYSDLKPCHEQALRTTYIDKGPSSGEEAEREDEDDELQGELEEEEMDMLHYQEEGWELPDEHANNMNVDHDLSDPEGQDEPPNPPDLSHSRTSQLHLLGLLFRTAHQLNQIVNEHLFSGPPRFIHHKIKVAGEYFEVFYCDVLQCVRALFGDPGFMGVLAFTPEHHYANADRTVRIYFDMHTEHWWWDTQKEIKKRKPGTIIIPIIISSDKTQLTVFSSKTAYPAACHRVTTNLFHTCMSAILKPLVKAGIHGIKIKSGDIFTMYIRDYPEQLLVTCCKNGRCPKCDIPPGKLGDTTAPDRPLHELRKVFSALAEVGNTAATDLPYINVFLSITPNILHQIHQGIVKHAFGVEELDIQLFLKGIMTLQRVTGKEHAHMWQFLLGLIAGLPLCGDFSYLAQYPAHTSDTLQQLHSALQHFHTNKAIFVDLDIREHFHIPKLHSFDHYLNSIKVFGMTDNYDTQHTEQLHIDFVKKAYRATNHKDEFPQMTIWHTAYIEWRSDCDWPQRPVQPAPRPPNNQGAPISPSPSPVLALADLYSSNLSSLMLTCMKLAKWPTIKVLCFDTSHQVDREVRSFIPWFNTVTMFHCIKFLLEDAQDLGIMDGIHDAAHACPEQRDSHRRKGIMSAESN